MMECWVKRLPAQTFLIYIQIERFFKRKTATTGFWLGFQITCQVIFLIALKKM